MTMFVNLFIRSIIYIYIYYYSDLKCLVTLNTIFCVVYLQDIMLTLQGHILGEEG